MTENTDQPASVRNYLDALFSSRTPEQEAETDATLMATFNINRARNAYQKAIVTIGTPIMKRELALQASRGLRPTVSAQDKAYLALHGLRTEGTLKTVFTLGANRRRNKAVLQKIELVENLEATKAKAVYDAAVKAAYQQLKKDLKAQTPKA